MPANPEHSNGFPSMVNLGARPTHGEFPLLCRLLPQSGNNLVFRSFFEKQKLTGHNFIDWYRQLRLVLSTEDKENYLEHPLLHQLHNHNKFLQRPLQLMLHVKRAKRVAVAHAVLTMDIDIQRKLAHLGAYDMRQQLKAMFSNKLNRNLLRREKNFQHLQAGGSWALEKELSRVSYRVDEKEEAIPGLRGSKKLKPGALSLYWAMVIVQPLKQLELIMIGSLVISIVLEQLRTNPSKDTSLDHEEDDQEINEPQSDINPIRRSTRTRRPTDRLCLYIDTEEHELGDLGTPANNIASLLDPESKNA
ncbi:hypothetical protein Tco_0117172 [Tanacetum coccineum]